MKKAPNGESSPALLIVLAVILLCAAGFLVYSMIKKPATETSTPTATNTATALPTSVPTEMPQPTSAAPSTGTDNSNTSLDSDLQQINTKIGAASAASGQVDTSLQNQSADSVPVQ